MRAQRLSQAFVHFSCTVALAAVAVCAAGCASNSDSKEPAKSAAPGNAEASRQVVAKVTVTSVDHDTRTMILKSDSGKSLAVLAGPEVKNFDKIRAGDSVTLRYTESIAVSLLKPGAAATPASTSLKADAGQDGKNKTLTGQMTATVRIDSVDTQKNVVVFTGPQGVTQVVDVVNPDGKEFIKGLKPGDQVEITYTAAVALSVEKL